MRFPVGVVLLSLAAFVLLISVVAAWRVDCSKFVFAPKCRGVSAKRASQSAISGDPRQTLEDTERDFEANSFTGNGLDEDETVSLPAKNHVRELYDLSRLERQSAHDRALRERRARLAEVFRSMAEKLQDDTQ